MHPHAFIRMCLSPLKYYAHLKQVKSSVCPASWHKNKLGIVFFLLFTLSRFIFCRFDSTVAGPIRHVVFFAGLLRA
jgi:hypothetical protein